ncbi:MAG: 2-dehydropantoate 2-reductase [Pseudomonadota bacterium]
MGIGATGAVLAAALLQNNPDTPLIVSNRESARRLKEEGLSVSGAIELKAQARVVHAGLEELPDPWPEVILIATKTFHLPRVLEQASKHWRPGTVLVSTHNGLGTEDLIAERFGAAAAMRMSLNYGASLQGPGRVSTAFFNRPNPLGCLDPSRRPLAADLAASLSRGGLDTEAVEDIRFFIWKKMIMKCTMASICAVTDRTIKGALEYPPTREIADNCFQEILAVAKAKGYDLGPDYLTQAMAYLEKVGVHKDSMCVDIANRQPTEIAFLGGKVLQYAREEGLAAPYYHVMTNLVKALEDGYLGEAQAASPSH